MKIIIEGEPKEIASLEQELKSGKTQQVFNVYSSNSPISPAETARQTCESARDMLRRR